MQENDMVSYAVPQSEERAADYSVSWTNLLAFSILRCLLEHWVLAVVALAEHRDFSLLPPDLVTSPFRMGKVMLIAPPESLGGGLALSSS